MDCSRSQFSSESIRKCPFSGAAAGPNVSKEPPGSLPARCPFSGASSAAVPKMTTDGKCPFGFGRGASAIAGSEGKAQDGLVCPMGFGSAKKPKAVESALVCSRCLALFFDAVRTDCQHYFCKACIEPCSDCLMCGADVGSLTPEPQLEALVELFMELCGNAEAFEAAAKQRTAAEIQAAGADSNESPKDHGSAGGTQADTEKASSAIQADSDKSWAVSLPSKDEAAKSEFMLESALRSMAGGNFAAAAARFGRCREQLTALAEAAGKDGWSETCCCRLGDICGSQGMCQQRLGNLEPAEGCFRDSISFLEKCPVRSSQVAHALAVSHNKLGDLRYARQQLGCARSCYKEALAIRQLVLDLQGTGENSTTHVSAALNLVTSLLKVADVEEALGNHGVAIDCARKAGDVLVSISGSIVPGSAEEAKHRGLQNFHAKLTTSVDTQFKGLRVS